MKPVWPVAALTVAACLGAGLGAWAGAGPPRPAGGRSEALTLHCSDSVGQQGGGEAVNGVTGLELSGSSDPSSLSPVARPGGGHDLVYKAFLAVSAADAPAATVSVVAPPAARLVYGRPGTIGRLAQQAGGRGLVLASRPGVRLPSCGPEFTGYVGGVVLPAPACVTVAVLARGRAVRVAVPVGTGCPPAR